jgi:hypothetical protein
MLVSGSAASAPICFSPDLPASRTQTTREKRTLSAVLDFEDVCHFNFSVITSEPDSVLGGVKCMCDHCLPLRSG